MVISLEIGYLFILVPPKANSIGGKSHWLLCLYDQSDIVYIFLSHKDMLMIELVCFVKTLYAGFGIKVRAVRCDNAGENKDFDKRLSMKT